MSRPLHSSFIIRHSSFILLLLSPRLLLADGVMFAPPRPLGQAEQLVSSPKQQAILIVNDPANAPSVTVILRTHFSAGPAELAWIIPVPAQPTNIQPRPDDLFTQLDQLTTPRFFIESPDRPAFHFGCAALNAREGEPLPASVRPEASGSAGIFHYDVLGGTPQTTAQDITAWLFANGYAVPPSLEPALAPYLEKHYHFLALRLRPEASTAPTLAPHPISYTYAASSLVYPLIISRPSAAPQNEIVLYILANSRYAAANWKNVSFNDIPIHLDPFTPSGTDYEQQFQLPAQHDADTHFFITEFADPITIGDYDRKLASAILNIPYNPAASIFDQPLFTHSYLTRLRTLITPETMDRDLLLVPVSHWPDIRPTRTLARPHQSSLASPALPIFLLLLLAHSLLRRPRPHNPRLLPKLLALLALALLPFL